MLAETVKYSDVVTWITNGVVNYCQNTTTAKFNQIPAWMRTNNWSGTITFSKGTPTGNGALRDYGKFTMTLTSGTPIASVSSSTVQSKVEQYIKLVNTTLSANVSNDYVQGLYDAIICFCNDNIRIATAACPFINDKNKISYYTCPIFEAESTIGATDFHTNIKVEASDMLNTLNDFSSIVRKYAHPKLHTFTYSISAHH